jgi:holo-[acyl-carrier protein] synthase
MGLRVGTDLVSVDAVRDSLRTHAERYLERIYTAQELADCTRDGTVDAERLAARFAAKEATIKVLRPGDEPVPWRTIEVVRNPGGWVDVSLTDQAAALAAQTGLSGLALSVSHEGAYASAVVVAEIETGGQG